MSHIYHDPFDYVTVVGDSKSSNGSRVAGLGSKMFLLAYLSISHMKFKKAGFVAFASLSLANQPS